MTVYTYSEARRNLASVLDEAEREGEVRITRRDGSTFTLKPTPKGSPFDDVEPVSGTGVTLAELNAWIPGHGATVKRAGFISVLL